MMRTSLACVAFAFPGFLVSAGEGPRSVAVSVRALAAPSPKVEVEFRNLTDAPLDYSVYVELTLRSLDQPATGGEQSTLYSSIDPATGQFGGYYADGSTVRLQLQAGQIRAIRIDLDKLKWSLGPNWVWRPLDLWQMADAGTYALVVDFGISAPRDRIERVFAGPVKLRIVSQ